jgi:hypothetical protein
MVDIITQHVFTGAWSPDIYDSTAGTNLSLLQWGNTHCLFITGSVVGGFFYNVLNKEKNDE